jgi:hypothetical protein
MMPNAGNDHRLPANLYSLESAAGGDAIFHGEVDGGEHRGRKYRSLIGSQHPKLAIS